MYRFPICKFSIYLSIPFVLFSETGGLFMLAIRLMQLFSDYKSDFSKLSAILGLYFQIRDDYCNLRVQEVIIYTF